MKFKVDREKIAGHGNKDQLIRSLYLGCFKEVDTHY